MNKTGKNAETAQKPMRQYVMTFESHYAKQINALNEELITEVKAEDVEAKFKIDNAEEVAKKLSDIGIPVSAFKPSSSKNAEKFNVDKLYIGTPAGGGTGNLGKSTVLGIKDGKGTIMSKKK